MAIEKMLRIFVEYRMRLGQKFLTSWNCFSLAFHYICTVNLDSDETYCITRQ